jgi:hypothetical protein
MSGGAAGGTEDWPRRTRRVRRPRAVRHVLGGLAVTVYLATPAAVHAQDAAPAGVVRVFVQRAASGEELRGEILELGPATMTLLVGRRSAGTWLSRQVLIGPGPGSWVPGPGSPVPGALPERIGAHGTSVSVCIAGPGRNGVGSPLTQASCELA